MSSTSIISIIVIIVAVILVDVFCGDVTNIRQTGPWQNNQNSGQKSPEMLPDSKNTTAWPTLDRRGTQNPTLNRNTPQLSRGTTPSPKKWIQQNNIWIRNEQASSGGNVAPQNVNSDQQGVRGAGQQNLGGNVNVGTSVGQNIRQGGNRQNLGSNRQNLGGQQKHLEGNRQNLGGHQQNVGASDVNRGDSQIQQTNRQQALINGLGGNQQNLGSSKVNRGNSQVHQTNRQQALINGLGGNQQNLGLATPSLNANSKPLGPSPVSSTTLKSNINPTAPTNKPMSYAGAVGPKIPGSPVPPKTGPISPLSPQPGGPKKDALPSTGPTGNNENTDDGQNVSSVGPGDTTDEELREFSEVLLRKDTNNAMKYVTLNLQGMTSSRSANDEAPLPLIKIEPDAYKIPSIEKMMLLYNNYFLDAGQNEVYTGQERIEENNLLDTVLATPVMQYARSFLIQKEKIGKDPKEFKDLLRQIWFNMYSRGQGRIGSSGFEHIFLAEIKNNQVSGLHNWVYFNEEEKQNRANYLGYLKKLDLGEKGAILKYHFTFHDIDKPVGSMFIGTSPELELALYSTCFVLRADKICPLKMNGNKFIIRTYTYRYRGKNMIGSAFPEI